MKRGLVYFGLLLIIAGIIAYMVFPTYIYTSADSVISDKYQNGDTLTIYGTITSLRYSQLLNLTIVELDGNLTVLASGQIHGFKVGQEVVMKIKKVTAVNIGNFELAYWFTEQKEIQSVELYEHVFMGVGILGVAITLAGASARR